MNEYLVNKADLDAVADAINNLIKSTTPLVFPDDFISKLNDVEVVKYSCRFETYNCTHSTKPSSLTSQSTFEVTVTPEPNYMLPDDIYCSGCDYSWNSTTGCLKVLKVHDNVRVVINAIGMYKITYKLDGCSRKTGATSTVPNTSQFATFTLEEGRTYPSTVKITNATLVSWNASTGDLVYRDPTGNMIITIYCTPYSFNVSASSTCVSHIATYTDTIATDETKTISVTAKTGYLLSARGVNCTATLTQIGTTGKYTLTVSGATGPATVSIIGFEA